MHEAGIAAEQTADRPTDLGAALEFGFGTLEGG